MFKNDKNKPTVLTSDEFGWYVIGQNFKYGPYSAKQLIHLYYKGIVKPQHICVLKDSNDFKKIDWVLAKEFKAKSN